MVKTVTDFCDCCNQVRSIEIDYIDVSELNNKVFIKGKYNACKNCTKLCELYSKAENKIKAE